MKLIRVLAIAAFLTLHAIAIHAENIVASTSAQIVDGDIGRAREIAVRRAISRAVESKNAIVTSQTIVATNSVSDTTQIRSEAIVKRNLHREKVILLSGSLNPY